MSSSSVHLGYLDPVGRKVTDARGFARNAHAMITHLHFAHIMEQAAPIEIVEAFNVLSNHGLLDPDRQLWPLLELIGSTVFNVLMLPFPVKAVSQTCCP